MAGRLSPKAAAKLSALDGLENKIQHAHGLVEQFAAAARHGKEAPLSIPLRRAFGQLKFAFLGAGLDTLSQLAGSMEIAASRGGAAARKVRILREGIGSMRHQVELERRSLRTESSQANTTPDDAST